jgi:DNA polymerase III subunit delta
MERQWLQELKKGKTHPVYFFYGQESFLIEETVNWMCHQLAPAPDHVGSVVRFDLEEVSIQTLVQEAETLPFFGERRLIIGKNAIFLTTLKEKGGVDHRTDLLLAYLANPVRENILLLIAPSDKLDKRKKIVKSLEKHACTLSFPPLSERELLGWVQKRCKQLGVEIQPQAAKELLLLVGHHLCLLQQECVKLATYVGQKGTILPSTVAELVPRTLEQDVFQLIDRIACRRVDEAFQIWYDLLYQREEPIRISALIIRQFRLLLQVRVLSQQGFPEKEIAAQLKIHPYPVKLALKQGAELTESTLRSLLAQAITTDQEMKSGKIDKTLAVERLLLYVNLPTA